MTVPQNAPAASNIPEKLVKFCDFAWDFPKTDVTAGTAIAVPYGYADDKNAAPTKAGAAALMFGNFRPNMPDSAFNYDTAAGPHPPLRLRLGAPSPKGKALGAI